MDLNEMIKKHRQEELKAVYKIISQATVQELANIISEIRVCHDNLLVFNKATKSLDKVESISINSEHIQLNVS